MPSSVLYTQSRPRRERRPINVHVSLVSIWVSRAATQLIRSPGEAQRYYRFPLSAISSRVHHVSAISLQRVRLKACFIYSHRVGLHPVPGATWAGIYVISYYVVCKNVCSDVYIVLKSLFAMFSRSQTVRDELIGTVPLTKTAFTSTRYYFAYHRLYLIHGARGSNRD